MEQKFSEEIVKKLIEEEIDRSTKEGMELYLKLSQELMTESEPKKRLKAMRGYGVWWSTDSGVFLKDVKISYVKKLEEELYEISALCRMEIQRARELLPDESPEEGSATITMKVDEKFDVKEFNFQWI